MVEDPPQVKNDEQYPLLMVAGSGDGVKGTPAVVSSVWNVTSCNPKNSWKDRWPEFLSACWMTLIIFGISFLVFYVIGMIACRQQAYILVKCNSSSPVADVFYHQITNDGKDIVFSTYAGYLSEMAKQYPSLTFNVYFLVEEPFRNQQTASASRHQGFYAKLIPIRPTYFHEDRNKREIKLFQKQHQNVNITVMPLSKFMAATPLKYKWHNVPINYLLFYAKVFTVWQNGGIAIDLRTYNSRFNNLYQPDKRLGELLAQFTNGKKSGRYERYAPMATKQRNEDDETLSFINYFPKEILSEIRALFNKSLSFFESVDEKPTSNDAMAPTLVRTHRNKRSISSDAIESNNTNRSLSLHNTSISTDSNIEHHNKNASIEIVARLNDITNASTVFTNNNTKIESMPENNGSIDLTVNLTLDPKLIFVYDVSMYSNYGSNGGLFQGMGLNQMIPEAINVPNVRKPKPQDFNRLVTLDYDGLFVAAAGKEHPFLGHLLSERCRHVHPKCAIQDVRFSHCNGLVREDAYCDTIRVI